MSKTYRIHEIFESLQGEGLHTGTAALFVRFAGCNLKCSFCDTDFSVREEVTLDELASSIADSKIPTIILTGGEPALQIDEALIQRLHEMGRTIHIETNGTLPLPEDIDWITCSPKNDRLTDLHIQKIDELKVVYTGQDMSRYEEMITSYNPTSLRLQPCDTGNAETSQQLLRESIQYILSHPQWRLSLQTHKLIDIQ